MKKLSRLLLYVLFALITIGFIDEGSGNKEKGVMKFDMIKEIKYSYGDASIPPEYHRSFSVTVASNDVRIVVDSYGKIISDEVYNITNEQFVNIISSFKRNQIRNCSLRERESCPGGTSERISCRDEKSELFSGQIYHCGSRNGGNMCGNIASFANDVKSLIPNLKDLLKE